VPELAGKFIVAGPRVLVVLSDGPAAGDGKLPTETVLHPGDHIFARGGEFHRRGVIRSRAWDLGGPQFGPACDFAELPHAAALVGGEEVAAFLVDAEGDGVGTRARGELVLVLLVRFTGEGVGGFR